jgi:hypothetical protein
LLGLSVREVLKSKEAQMQFEKENLAELEWDTKQRVLEDTNFIEQFQLKLNSKYLYFIETPGMTTRSEAKLRLGFGKSCC